MTNAAVEPKNELFEAALGYRAQGRPVFPVCAIEPHEHRVGNRRVMCEDKNRGKTPLVPWKDFQSRVPSEREVQRWWRRWPTANIGMATGQLSGIVVGDLDGELAQLKATQYGYAPGPYVLTGRPGGRHLFFAWRTDAPHNFAKREGIDYRGDGGYVVLPPSRHILGTHYRWGVPITDISALPQLPEWFDLLAGHIERPSFPRFSLGEAIAEHERNDTLFRLASSMRGNGLDEDAIYAALTATNAARCQPPLDDDEVYKLAHNVATRYERGSPPQPTTTTRRKQQVFDPGRLLITRVRDIAAEMVAWVWKKRVPKGKFVLLQGDPGLGKSVLAIDIAARVSTGRPMPDEPPDTTYEPRDVVLMVNEDDLASTIRPRLEVARADLDRVWILQGQYDDENNLMPLTIENYRELRYALEHDRAAMLLIDPLFGHLPAGVSISREEEIRHLLAPLIALVADLDVALVGIRHLNQSVELPSQYRGLGAGAWTAQARSQLSVMVDPTHDGRKRYVFGRSKGNLGIEPPVLTYTLEAETEDSAPYVVWGDPSPMTWDELISEAASAKKGDSAVGKAQVAVLRVISDAAKDGITWADVMDIIGPQGHSEHSARRARTDLAPDIVSRKVKAEDGQMQTRWYLLEHFQSAQDEELDQQNAHVGHGGFLGQVGQVESVLEASEQEPKLGELANLPKKTNHRARGQVGQGNQPASGQADLGDPVDPSARNDAKEAEDL